MIDRTDNDWYRDAVIYQLHVKAFFDDNNDGIGDFSGLIRKLDYIQQLGVSAIWLLPFYPSPLRDDGYDIADYRGINERYGSMRDFKRFIRAAHDRGLRVITELVVNHTSDQHAWFQRARHAKPGSRHRDYYVWSDTDQKYLETRIIFLDTEHSNWAWDPVAQSYYWHRFYSHQPDLNFDNPRVLEEILAVMHFWLDAGVDGMRLDAVPYLVERDGTNNENLPETHAVLRQIRAAVDERYEDRMLLAEANQWPEDVQEYFGAGDECHMAFHFPLMPRMYMAVAQEDRYPIIDIMRQTPELPGGCQWAIFLRNHDELTLEMVTDNERDYLWRVYADDNRMRLNLGIRRRLAPLMQQDMRRIQLMNGMLMSMPGTPVVYYGDEIGMGDNIYLGDRDGVRTPMQWSPDRNGGFSRADPSRLYLPAIMDAAYSYQAINVEAQERSPHSLLNWMRRVIGIRQQHQAFGRGEQTFLMPGNRKVLAYLRHYESEVILCVFNLAHTAQAVELDLSAFRGRVPVEMLGSSVFPPIGDLPYLLTLSGYGFHWFLLTEQALEPAWHQDVPVPMPELTTLIARRHLADIVAGREGAALMQRVLPSYLPNQRWFAAKSAPIAEIEAENWSEFDAGGSSYLLLQMAVELRAGEQQRYFLPLGVTRGSDQELSPLLPYALGRVRRMAAIGLLHDAVADAAFAGRMVAAMQAGRTIPARQGEVRFASTRALAEAGIAPDTPSQRLQAEQSNTSIAIGEQAVLKILRRLSPGVHPEIEIGRYLTEVADYRHAPRQFGSLIHYDDNGEQVALAVLQEYVSNQGDGWSYTLDYLDRFGEELLGGGEELRAQPAEQVHSGFLRQIATLARRTAELHRAFALPTDDPAFAAEAVADADLQGWADAARAQLEAAFAALEQVGEGLDESARAQLDALRAQQARAQAMIEDCVQVAEPGQKTRLHGDFHLGQVLVVPEDFYLVDFEGEPAKPLAQRRQKHSPLRDVAGMVRSFHYAAATALPNIVQRGADTRGDAAHYLRQWQEATSRTFLDTYFEAVGGCPSIPADEDSRQRLLRLFLLEKAAYEICYEANNRPHWLGIPSAGALELLGLNDNPEAP
ncbi:MAG: maltose alpha-D-glucosyltransferase [Pseudomonadota bacterium]|nr:maltose alpha-D-glucosyltransferase [Pseudomonadota bacterium]